jgi:ribosomal protein S18 acetylase RimI-like enzyme
MITFKKATTKEIDFIIETIIESEKSGTDKFSYSTLLGLTEQEVTDIVKEIMEEKIEGQKFCLEQFIIALVDGIPAGACSSWIEGASGSSSGYLQGQILLAFFPRENVVDAHDNFEIAKDLSIEREQNALQIESVYVKDSFRGLGLAGKVILEHIQNAVKENPKLEKAQIIVAKTNDSAVKSYAKSGFEVAFEKHSDNNRILEFLPADTLVIMENVKPLSEY